MTKLFICGGDKYIFGTSTISLPVSFKDLPPELKIENYRLLLKSSFHISLVCIGKIIEKFNAKVVLIWGPGEEKLVQEIATLMKQKPLIAPGTKIREMAELCKRCRLVICSEGGPLHIANSQGINTISIFGPVDEKVYGPYPKSEKNIVITSNADCRPCYKKFKLPDCEHKKCLEDISVDNVFDTILNKVTL